jgi:hypothetical protein
MSAPYRAESAAKGADPALHPAARCTLTPQGFRPLAGLRWVRTDLGWLHATDAERAQGYVLLPMERGSDRAVIQ